MDLFKTFATDEQLEIEGRWVPFNADTSFKIARAYNKQFSRMFQREFKANRLALEAKGVMSNSKRCESTSRMLHQLSGGISQGTKESERQAELALDGYTVREVLQARGH